MSAKPTTPMPVRLEAWFQRKVENPAFAAVGGRARLRVITLLACMLALDSADKGMIGAIAVPLEQSMGIGSLQLALLIAAPTLITALATLPFGALADCINRVNMLAACILGWGALMVISGAAISYLMLLLTRMALGVLVAVVVPSIASLIGDYFQPGERARIWGYVLAGELGGVAVGFLIAGNVAAVGTWRWSFWTLAFLSFVLAPVMWRLLPEPARGGQSHIPENAARVPAAGEGRVSATVTREQDTDDQVQEVVEEHHIHPHHALVLRDDPAVMPFGPAVRYVLSIHTYVVLICASALGYLFFGALITFGVVYMRNRFGLDQVVATTLMVGLGAGAIIGVLVSGRIGDWLIKRGRTSARVFVAAVAFLLTAVMFLAALLVPSIFFAAPLLFFAATALGATNPCLDAARLDIMHFGLWGRAESVRGLLRYVAQALAPLLFAGIYIFLSGGGNLGDIASGHVQQSGRALTYTFCLMLIPVVAASCLMFIAVRVYPRDVATAMASEHAASGD